MSKPSRSISLATFTISSSEGVMRPDRPIDVDLLPARRLQDLLGRHHDAEIDDLVIVAGEHDADDVLADIVHVALHGRHQDLAGGRALGDRRRLAFSASMNGIR